MTTQKRGSAAFAVCGSFCTLETALEAARMLTLQGWDLLPIMSFAAGQDTRFGTGTFWKERLEALTGHPVLDTLQAVEPLGPRQMAQALVIAPCTGATLARLAAGLSDTPVTLAAKSLLRVGCPVLVGISTSGNSPNVVEAIELAKTKGVYCVGMTAAGGGKMATLCDECIAVPAKITARAQEMHILIGHILCELVDGE